MRTSCVALLLLVVATLAPRVAAAAGTGVSSAVRDASMKMVVQAEAMIRQAGAQNPPNTDKVNQARLILQRAIALDPKNDSAYVDLGFCWGVLNYPEAAVAAYHHAVEINPSAANFKELADIYMRVGKSDEALMAANAGLTKNPRDAPLWNAKGMALSDMARYSEAAKAFKQALAIDPNFMTAYGNLVAIDPGFKRRSSVRK